MARKAEGCRRIRPTDTSCTSPVQATAEHSPGAKMPGVRERWPQDRELYRGRRQRKDWSLARDLGASLEQELAGDAFVTSGATYPSRQAMGTPPREDWKQKLETLAGTRKLRFTAEEKTRPCPSAKKNMYTKGSCPGAPSHGQVIGYRSARHSKR